MHGVKSRGAALLGAFAILAAFVAVFVALTMLAESDEPESDLEADGQYTESPDGQTQDGDDALRVTVDQDDVADSAESPDGALDDVLGEMGSMGVDQLPVLLTAQENLDLVASSPLRNTFDDASPWAALSADEISYSDVTEPGPMPPDRPAGIFHENCNFSHFAYDDSILFPGRPGLAHLHMFFGNSQSNAHSTSETIRNTGASTCAHNELNRSSYWAPAVFTGDHRVLIPEIMNVYYTELDDRNGVVPFPEQFQMIQGDAMATEPPTAFSDGNWPMYWKCGWHETARRDGGGPAGGYQGTIPYCDPNTYTHLEMGVQFGHCWDGINNGTNGDPKSHIQYPGDQPYQPCPEGTQHVPAIRMRIHFRVDAAFGRSDEWYLSSDVRVGADQAHSIIGNRGASIHGDWVNGWDPETLEVAVDTCLNVNRDCWRNFGDARQAKLDPGQSEARTVAFYNGPFVADAESLDPLCPSRSGRSGPERALCALTVMANMAGMADG